MRRAAFALALVALVVAGCTSDAPDEPTDAPEPTSQATPPVPPPNAPPAPPGTPPPSNPPSPASPPPRPSQAPFPPDVRLEPFVEDNPFVGREGRDEIWAYGLRNPWRFSFDRSTGELFIGDVGQGAWEEIDHQPASSDGGENYGWDRYEGDAAYENAGGREGLTFPILSYARTGGHCAVTGGYVYRGEAVPALVGRYVFGDYCSGTVWVAQPSEDGWESAVLLETEHRISSFGEDEAGELYLVDHEGALLRFVAA